MIKLTLKDRFLGANPYNADPVIVVDTSISDEIVENASAYSAAMIEVFGSWYTKPALDFQNARLDIAKFLADWSLAVLNEVRGYLHAAGARQAEGNVEIWLGYHDHKTSIRCLEIAANLFVGIGAGTVSAEAARSRMAPFWQRCQKHHPDFQARILMVAARQKGIPYGLFLDNTRYWQYGWGKRSLWFHESSSDEDSKLGSNLTKDKSASKSVFAMLGAPVARQALVSNEADLENAAAEVGWPCVIKPLDRGRGKGVTTDIRNLQELTDAFRIARSFSDKSIMLESHIEGDVHRLLVVRGEFVAAIRRETPSVLGDGSSTVQQLIDGLNLIRRQKERPGNHEGEIPVDNECLLTLAKQGLKPSSVLEQGRKVQLRRLPFQSTGAVNFDVTNETHRDVKAMAVSLSETFGIKIAGLDYVTDDISKPFHKNCAVLEINAMPSLRGLLVDDINEACIGETVLGDQPGRIPVDLLVVSKQNLDGFELCTRCRDDLGWVYGGHIGLASTRFATSKQSVAKATRALLRNRAIERALIVCIADDLLKDGMAVDRVRYAYLEDQSLSAEWQRVLRDNSEQLISVSDPEHLRTLLTDSL